MSEDNAATEKLSFPPWRQQLARSLHVSRSKAEAKYFQVANVDELGHPKVRTMVFRGFLSLAQSAGVAESASFTAEHSDNELLVYEASASQNSAPNTKDSSHYPDLGNALTAVTDTRSDKVSQWQSNALSELHWYFAKTREQYRLSCTTRVISLQDPDDCSEEEVKLIHKQWQNLSSAAKSGFFVPAPKTPLSQAKEEDETASRVYGEKSVNKGEEANEEHKKPSPFFALVLFMPYEVDYLDLKSSPHTRIIYRAIHRNIYRTISPTNSCTKSLSKESEDSDAGISTAKTEKTEAETAGQLTWSAEPVNP